MQGAPSQAPVSVYLRGDDMEALQRLSDEVSAKSVRNLPGVHVISPDQHNTYDVLDADDLVFSVEALNAYNAAGSAQTKEEVSA